MSILLKKEIRLLRPSWIVALLLAAVQAITRPYDFYFATVLYFGLTMLAQPAERIQIWKTKLTVLVAAFGSVFVVWFIAYRIAAENSQLDAPDRESARNLFITVCLMATATFTGGLWTTLLLRQLASAFWLTLLVPVTLAGFSGAFLATLENDPLVIAVMSTIIGIYSLAGFLFARWLYFRAQDVGWAGGVIVMPEWNFLFARTRGSAGVRVRRPVLALFKKELQLQSGMLTGAACMCLLHTVVVFLRLTYQFKRDSAAEILTSIAWMLWLVLPLLIGCISFAEERKLGIIENQLCLSASRRTQFAVKFFTTLCLGILIGGVMPACFESIPVFEFKNMAPATFLYGMMAVSAWITLVSMFASSLSKSFLQAVGIAFVTSTLLTSFTVLSSFHDFPPTHFRAKDLISLFMVIPTIIGTFTGLAYVNFTRFREGWPLWRRTLVTVVLAIGFANLAGSAICHRAWEALEPAEPAHGPAKLSLANPAVLRSGGRDNLVVRLPGGRLWFDHLSMPDTPETWPQGLITMFSDPLPYSTGPGKCISGSNWIAASAAYWVAEISNGPKSNHHIPHYRDFAEAIGVQKNGTLWFSEAVDTNQWPANQRSADHMVQFGTETNWLDTCGEGCPSVLLLKKDGTLWCWGAGAFGSFPPSSSSQGRHGLGDFPPRQIVTDSNWTALDSIDRCFMARRANGSIWWLLADKHGKEVLVDESELSQAVTQNPSAWRNLHGEGAYVDNDGTLWVYGRYFEEWSSHSPDGKLEVFRCNQETNWVGVAMLSDWMVALKSDGTLWQWPQGNYPQTRARQLTAPPVRLGVHSDWISLVATRDGVITLAADGSLWFWPDRTAYDYTWLLIQPPKQPKLLGNLFAAAK